MIRLGTSLAIFFSFRRASVVRILFCVCKLAESPDKVIVSLSCAEVTPEAKKVSHQEVEPPESYRFKVYYWKRSYSKAIVLCSLSGHVKQQKIGPFTLSYTIDKLDDEQQFQIDFGASVCPNNGGNCIFDIDIVQDYRVPIPFCSSNFSLSLPG